MDISKGIERMDDIVSLLRADLAKTRTGRATPKMLDEVMVTVYDSKMPINHIANVSVPDARTIVIQPWDSSNIEALEKAILSSDIGLTPIVDGEIVRISVPSLTQELREKYVKEMKEKIEESKIEIRAVRHKMMDCVEDSAKDGGVSEDDIKRQKGEVEKAVVSRIEKLGSIAEEKEKELMTV